MAPAAPPTGGQDDGTVSGRCSAEAGARCIAGGWLLPVSWMRWPQFSLPSLTLLSPTVPRREGGRSLVTVCSKSREESGICSRLTRPPPWPEPPWPAEGGRTPGGELWLSQLPRSGEGLLLRPSCRLGAAGGGGGQSRSSCCLGAAEPCFSHLLVQQMKVAITVGHAQRWQSAG